ncbi:protein FAM187B-like [Hypanus sabinus]|uniref:protein FAM187B-like n=1 Tax=Hypanus sabinus TaxID=79690 RepID=UPI0028C42B8A|nr:protein FAM187B-like [Hypanus sabinus]
METQLTWVTLVMSRILPITLLLTSALSASAGSSNSCDPNRSCLIPFLSRNPATLICPNVPSEAGEVAWAYSNSSEPGSGAVVLVGAGAVPLGGGSLGDLQSRCRFSPPHISIRPATVRDSGVYLCQMDGRTLAYYEADVQDVEKAHLSGKPVGVPALPSTFREVKGQHWKLFTVWNAWQDCDRCGAPGERRRLGFCYARPVVGQEQAVPCGIAASAGRPELASRGPEIALEPCQVPCLTESPYEAHVRRLELPGRRFVPLDLPRTLLIETYLVNVNGNASLKCPGASAFTPVSWRRDSVYITRDELSRRRGSTHSLDELTGRSAYTIAGAQKDDEGVYRCYVSGELAASFHLKVLDPYRRGAAAEGNAISAVWYFLATVSMTFVLLGFLSFLYIYCTQVRRHQVVHW